MLHIVKEGQRFSVDGAEFLCQQIGTNGAAFVLSADPHVDVIDNQTGVRFQSIVSIFRRQPIKVYTLDGPDTQVEIMVIIDDELRVKTTRMEVSNAAGK